MKINKLQKVAQVRQLIAQAKYDEAIAIIEKKLSLEPQVKEWRILYCKVLIDSEQLELAISWLQKLLLKQADQTHTELYFDVLRKSYEKQNFPFMRMAANWLIEHFPSNAMGWNFRGIAHLLSGEFNEALEVLEQAVTLDPDNVHILVNLINVYISHGRPDTALPYVEKALKLDPNLPVLLNNAGNAYRLSGDIKHSLTFYQRALADDPNNAEVIYNAGTAYLGLEDHEKALQYFRRALELRPDLSIINASIAFIYMEQGNVDEAIRLCESVLKEHPDTPNVWSSYGYLQAKVNRLNAAVDAYVKAIALCSKAKSALLLPGIYDQLLFCLLSHPDIPLSELVNLTREYNERFCLPLLPVKPEYVNELNPDKRIHLGFIGHSFMRHSCSRFVKPLIAYLDRNKVKLHIYATQGKEDEMTVWYEQNVDVFVRGNGQSDAQLMQRMAEDKLDVLVELDGHCFGNRLLLMAKKPAPVSLHWLDYGTTTGLSAIDYYLSDRFTAPAELQPIISEKIWHLEGHSTVFEPSAGMGEVSPLPYLTNGYITFGSLTRSIRVNHRVIKIWSAVLNALPESRLVLNSNDLKDPAVCEDMAQLFVANGIARERLLFGFDTPPWDVLRSIDIGLDCFPQNSGTTLMEMLYMGIPFVTLADRPPVGRIGTGILANLGCTQWIAYSEEEYAEKLVRLAHDIEGLQQIRQQLRTLMLSSTIMDPVFFAQSFERAVREMWRLYCEEHSK